MRRNVRLLVGFVLTMIALGASDSLKGVFVPIFGDHFALSATRVSWIITAGYLGNLFFLLAGGRFADRAGGKKTLVASIGLWLIALLAFILTDSYACLLVGVFFAMGTSTLINTTINITTPLAFAAAPGFIVNFLFFTQGIGTSGSQALAGHFGSGFGSWHVANAIVFAVGLAGFIFVATSPIPDRAKTGAEHDTAVSPAKPRLAMIAVLVLVFGTYFIAEHGILNWLVAWTTSDLSLSTGKAATYLAVFFGGITLGRLVLSPLVDRLGTIRALVLFTLVSAVLYIAGFAGGERTLFLLSLSGFTMAILYPTLVMSIRIFCPSDNISGLTGLVLSVASLFDIFFNILFGHLVDAGGYHTSVLILPAAMAAYALLFSLLVLSRRKKVTV